MVKHTVVRSYGRGFNKSNEMLDELLDKGYEVVFTNPFDEKWTTKYIEYILKEPEDKENITKQKSIRSFNRNYTNALSLITKYLEKGYTVIHSTPFLEKGTTEYIEYILKVPDNM